MRRSMRISRSMRMRKSVRISRSRPNLISRSGRTKKCIDRKRRGVYADVDADVDAYVELDVGVGVAISLRGKICNMLSSLGLTTSLMQNISKGD
jgi:hypothetical protein